VYRTLYAKIGNRHEAEDLTAEVFVTAMRPLRLSASTGEVRAYLLATSRTVLAAYWRRTLGLDVVSLTEDWLPDEAVGYPDRTTAPQQVEAILTALSARYRRILELRFLEACSLAEAATEMGITVGNAKVLQHRALRQAANLADEWWTRGKASSAQVCEESVRASSA
jgi:RNA polymerase sigma-70 factor (ECF subfamily)